MAETIERVYKITTDANQAVRELNKLNKSVGNIDTGLQKASAALKGAFAGAAVVTAINAITNAIGNSITAMDTLGKTTQKLGVSAQDFTALQHAAEMTDISTEKLSASITKLNKAIADAAGGGTSKGAESLRNLGVSIRDSSGGLRNTADIFRDVAQAMSEIPDGADKASIAMQLFGKSGADLIPLLNEGSEGLEAFAQQADELGLVISEVDTILADQFNDNLDLLSKQLEGSTNRLVSGLLPALTQLSGEFANGASGADFMTDAGQKLGKILLLVSANFDFLYDTMAHRVALFRDIGTLIGTIFSPEMSQNQTERNAEIAKAWDDLAANLKKNSEDIGSSWQRLIDTASTPAADIANNITDTINSDLEKSAAQYVSDIGAKITADLALIEPPVFTVAVIPEFKSSDLDVNQLSEDFNKQFSTTQLETTIDVNNQVSDSLREMSSQMDTAAHMSVELSQSMKETEVQSSALSTAIGQTVASSIDTLVDKLAAGNFSFKEFVRTTIIEVAKLIAKIQLLNAIKATSFGASLGLANGGAFSEFPLPQGVYNTPQFFPMAGTGKRYFANGGIGVMAEAGPEAIMPLSRGSDGRLGVEVKGGNSGNINIHNYSNSEVTARRVDDDIEIVINRVAADILRGGSKISRAMENTYSVNRVRAQV